MKSPHRLRFGEFEIDAQSGELVRRGTKLALQDQPARALLFLLERSGDVVTRQQLTDHLWSRNTFVDFERGLNKIVAKLRVALQDDPEHPIHIETVPQRGYRFIGPVQSLPAAEPARAKPRIDSLAVLPLLNLSGDVTDEYFADGFTDELISALATAASLRVISRTSVMTFKGTRKPLPAIASELRADAIVEGSVSRLGDRVRVIVQLIHAQDDRQLWSGRYERDIINILQLQAEVANSIAGQIHKVLGSPASTIPAGTRQVDPSAYEPYLKGNFLRQKLNPVDLDKSVAYLRRSIELDPSSAPAYASLACCYQFLGIFGLRHPLELFRQVRANAVRALELSPSLSLAQAALTSVSVVERWDWTSAEAECRRAVEMSPGESFSRAQLADYLSIRGKHNEAATEMQQALDLDPISSELNNWLALLHYRARRYDDAIRCCERVLEIDSHHLNVQWFYAWSLEQLGKIPQAVERLEEAVRASGGPHYRGQLGRLYGRIGEAAKARALLEELYTAAKQGYVSPMDFAMIHLGLDDMESMFHSVEEACQQRVWRTIKLTMPIFDPVRTDQRWWSLVRRIGLEDSVS